ncbi:unnamed protein product [Cyprideis torosa]|uniref:Uncharacterized protein n=1 Tax=Cyprideis torosa TaxID=163714 RepID=A0A7R8WGI4_9CRUS|nr:unnamed protein product [Cyprideis torosa]CAG0895353.1 unnamed protein product [Cyprideis torosa]
MTSVWCTALVIFAFLNLISANEEREWPECPYPMFPVGEKCYSFHKEWSEDFLTWDEAQRYCNGLYQGSQLAQFETATELQDVKAFLNQAMGRGCYDDWDGARTIWIGGVTYDDSEFVWADGTPIEVTDWKPGKPDGLFEERAIGLDCDERFLWEDWSLTWHNPFICDWPN